MNIGILGAGHIGATLGRLWSKAGHSVCFGTRHPGDHADLVSSLGVNASEGTPEQAAGFGDVILLAVPLGAIPALAQSVGSMLEGKVVLDATNPFPDRDGILADEAVKGGHGSSAWTATQLRGATIVKAFNMQRYATLETDAHRTDDPLGIALASDDDDALDLASDLVQDAGFEPVIVGKLDEGRAFDPGTPHFARGVRASELRREFPIVRNATEE